MGTLVYPVENESLERQIDINRESHANKWTILPTFNLNPKAQNTALRLNCFGDLHYFIKIGLRKHRLSNYFHRNYCHQFECEHLLEVFESPRDHFKTTIGSGYAIFRGLPFSYRDELYMRSLGYGDEYISWMYHIHDQNTRVLFAMEVIKNAWKVGKKIAREYEKNDMFRRLFPEIIPDSSCQWTQDALEHKRDFTKPDANQGEATYEFTGVDAALQSKHYPIMIFDDLFGKDALKSDIVAESTWDWFKLAAGAFDSIKNKPDEIPDVVVNGNRWSFKDLNWRIKKEMPEFKFHTHDAEGGCCSLHPLGQPIFPEEFSMKKLMRLKHWFGEYFYSCQFRNKPIPPGGNEFKLSDLRYFVYNTIHQSIRVPPRPREIANVTREAYKGSTDFTQSYKIILPNTEEEKRYRGIRHQVTEGVVEKDIPTAHLHKMLIVDPNHKGEVGRARHAILVLGIRKSPFRIYILDGWAEIASREDAVNKLYEFGEQWRIKTVWTEIAAGQTWLQSLLEMTSALRKSLGKWYFDEVLGFRDNRSANAKDDRIKDAQPYFKRNEVWLCQQSEITAKFREEYEEYPHGSTVDLLDVFGHAVQNMDVNNMSNSDIRNLISQQKQAQQHANRTRSSHTGY